MLLTHQNTKQHFIGYFSETKMQEDVVQNAILHFFFLLLTVFNSFAVCMSGVRPLYVHGMYRGHVADSREPIEILCLYF